MDKVFQKFLRSGIELSVVGVECREDSSKSYSPPLMHREVGFLPLSLLSRLEGAVLANFLKLFQKKFSNGQISRWKREKIVQANCCR